VKPCGFDLERTRREAGPFSRRVREIGWRGAGGLADGNAYFNRPGPRIVDALRDSSRRACTPKSFPIFGATYAGRFERGNQGSPHSGESPGSPISIGAVSLFQEVCMYARVLVSLIVASSLAGSAIPLERSARLEARLQAGRPNDQVVALATLDIGSGPELYALGGFSRPSTRCR
jgi:hypothetical protein